MTDIYADDMEPRIEPYRTVYVVHVPGCRYTHFALVSVDTQNGLCELDNWVWGEHRDPHRGYQLSDPGDKALWDAMQEVWSWLREWELVELKPIGPEDSEYFATETLTKERLA